MLGNEPLESDSPSNGFNDYNDDNHNNNNNMNNNMNNMNNMTRSERRKNTSKTVSFSVEIDESTIPSLSPSVTMDSYDSSDTDEMKLVSQSPNRPFRKSPSSSISIAESNVVSSAPSWPNYEISPTGRLEVKSLDEIKPLDSVGQGSSGVVQKVVHLPTNTVLAMKSVPLEMSEKKAMQMLMELKTLCLSNHENIVSFHGAFFRDGNIFLLLEFMDSGSLLDILKTIKIVPEKYLSRITRHVLEGLKYLHERRIIHRDLKPSNILLNTKGEVKIADFGVSGELNNTFDVKKSFVGTVTFMSPERITGKEHLYDSDLWSLGLLLEEAALGYFPYSNQDSCGNKSGFGFWDIMDKIVKLDPPQLPADRFSPEFCDFVRICLSKNTSDRTSSEALLRHPFVSLYDNANIDMASWVRAVNKQVSKARDLRRRSVMDDMQQLLSSNSLDNLNSALLFSSRKKRKTTAK